MSAAVRQMDWLEAIRAANRGMARAITNADQTYRDDVTRSIKILARGGQTFTADDVRALAGDPPTKCSPNLVGALFNAAAKAGQIEPVGFARSGRVIGHGNRLIAWRGAGRG